MTEFGKRLELARKAKAYSKGAILKAAYNTTSGMYSQWLNGSKPDYKKMLAIAELLKVDVDWLENGRGNMLKKPTVESAKRENFVNIRKLKKDSNCLTIVNDDRLTLKIDSLDASDFNTLVKIINTYLIANPSEKELLSGIANVIYSEPKNKTNIRDKNNAADEQEFNS